jgi:putative PIN family toxin of toxin-antitoxin system
MASDLRVVIDTSVLVSAVLLPRSVPRLAFDSVRRSGRILISDATIDEFESVLRRPKFARYIAEIDRLEFLARLVELAEIVEIRDRIAACRDPKDDKFLELAVSGGATSIISGDRDLLTLNPFRAIAILTPQEFVTRDRATTTNS